MKRTLEDRISYIEQHLFNEVRAQFTKEELDRYRKMCPAKVCMQHTVPGVALQNHSMCRDD